MSVRSARYNLFSLRNPKGLTVIPEERDAWAFLDAAGIKSSREQRAVIELVRGLKNAQLWSKMKAIYPFVGGTATTHKFNLKDPRDSDAAFRLTFNGGYTHNSNGITGNGTNAYAETYFNPSVQLGQNSWHGTGYSRTTGENQAMFGLVNVPPSGFAAFQISSRVSNLGYHGTMSTGANIWATYTNTDGSGYYISSRTASTTFAGFKNTDKKVTNTGSSSAHHNGNIYISARLSLPSTVESYSSQNLAFISFGDGLTDTDATALYNIVQRFQTSLGRQV